VNSALKGKKILVTGGTGSIGESIVKKALDDGAKLIKVFSNDENGQYEMEKSMNDNKKLRFLIGDIRDEDSVNDAARDIDIIFHAAALKHVDRCELNPFEAVSVNILGTKNIIKGAIKENVKKVISISTDKAVNPIGVMGSTKLLAEKMISAESFYVNSSTIFASVRFGNVLNTRGSILPFIIQQIAKGGPITLTDEHMMRFFMTREDAVNLILSAMKIAKGGEIFVSKIPFVKLKDLFECLKDLLAPKYGHKPSKIKTEIIGMRPGEKLIEELLTNFEMEHLIVTKKFFIIPPPHVFVHQKKNSKIKKINNARNYFRNLKPLDREEIISMLRKDKLA